MPKVPDPLCPLGFHPQVRWPTRCKRCFREYKEHANSKGSDLPFTNLRKDELSSSTSSLNEGKTGSYARPPDAAGATPSPTHPGRSTPLTLMRRNTIDLPEITESRDTPAAQPKSKTTDNLGESEKARDYSSIYSSLSSTARDRLGKYRSLSATGADLEPAPVRRRETPAPVAEPEPTPVRRREIPASGSKVEAAPVRRRDTSAANESRSSAAAPPAPAAPVAPPRSNSVVDSVDGEKLRRRKAQIQSIKEVSTGTDFTSPDVQFILEVKRSIKGKSVGSDDGDEGSSVAGTEYTDATETTLVESNYESLHEQISGLKKELEKHKSRCERLEREKDAMQSKNPRLAVSNGSSELMRLQQRVRDLEAHNEDLIDDKRSAELRVTELERELESRPSTAQTHKVMEEIRAKSSAAEALIEELMEENEELKREMRQMVEEMDELQDNFREDQADEYRDLKKELEQTAKNCRILQFKLRKAERRIEHLETDKHELEIQNQELRTPGSTPTTGSTSTSTGQDRVNALEQELAAVRDQLQQVQKELQNAQKTQGKTIGGPVLSKSRSLEGSGHLSKSTEDVSQVKRDLQDAVERENDIREQLKFAEEEAQSLRKKLSRVEEENESLVMQLKKMAMKKGRRTTPDSSIDKDEGISDDMDDMSVSELRLQLELNEQETAVLRRKMEDMEGENDRLSLEVAELQQLAKATTSVVGTGSKGGKELETLKNQLLEKNKEIQHLSEALTQSQKSKKVVVQRSRSLEGESALDLKRQLQLVEQEAAILRAKTHDLEAENEKVTSDNRRMALRLTRKGPPSDADKLHMEKLELEDKVKSLEKKLAEALSRASDVDKSPRMGRSGSSGRLSPMSGSENSVLKREKDILEKDLKHKEEQISTLSVKVQHLEKENENLHQRMEVRATQIKRTPKKPMETMTKMQLKKMVDELEAEVTDYCTRLAAVADTTSEGTKRMEGKIEDLKKELKTEKESRAQLENDLKDTQNKLVKVEDESKRHKAAASGSDGVNWVDKCDALEKERDELRKKLDSGNYVDLDTLQKVKQEKHKLQKELTDKDGRISEMEKKVKEAEDKVKRVEKAAKENKDRISDLEREIEEERTKMRSQEAAHKDISLNWLKERDDLKKQMNEVRAKAEELDSAVAAKEKKIKELELAVKEEVRKASDASSRKAEREIRTAKDEVSQYKAKMEDAEQKLRQAEMEKKSLNDRIQRQETDWRKERDQLMSRATDLEVEMKSERKKKDRLEKEHEQEIREKDDEVMGLRERIKRVENEMKSSVERYEELKNQDTRARELELELEKEHQEYEDLTAKYDLLEEDYVVIKAKLVMEKQDIEREFVTLKKEHETVEGELRTLRETFNVRQDTWIKEKLDMQERVKELEEKELRYAGDGWILERTRLKDIIEEKNQQLERLKRDEEAHRDHIDTLRRDNDDLRKKLEDFDKVTKIKRTMTLDTSEHDREIRELKNKLAQGEKAHKSDLTHTKMRYDSRIALLQEETQAAQMQLEKARRERDTLREMLEGAQRMIADLKMDPSRSKRTGADAARSYELEESMARIEEFHSKITSLEDELSEARMETSRVKTDYINEKSSWEIKVSELQTKINELEEDRVMTSGRSRIPGTRTRMELAWQKEREEQQRLIQESSTLARDLRQTLLEVEKERDRERLEARRRLEQVKRSTEEEQVDVRKKVTELQSDLLELRDAHAKLRTSCEKLRRDKERVERERDDARKQMTDNRKAENEEERRVNFLLNELQKMSDLCPLVLGESLRTSSVANESKRDRDVRQEKVREEFMNSLRQISQCGEEIKRLQQRGTVDPGRTTSFRRAMSTAPDDSVGTRLLSNGGTTPVAPKRVAYRRALSLEQKQDRSSIREIDLQSSQESLDSTSSEAYDSRYVRPTPLPHRSRTVDRDISLDRISTDSTRSESAVIPATPETKKKRGLMGKIKDLTRSRSIEDSGVADLIVNAGIKALIPGVSASGSDLSLDRDPSETRKEKKTVKEKITGIFKKSSSRASSMERQDSLEGRNTPAKDTGREVRESSSSRDRPLKRPPSTTNLTAIGSSSSATPAASRALRTTTVRKQGSLETNV